MPYQANRHFMHVPRGTDIPHNYRPGDPVLDFLDWPEHAQRALLNQGMVERIEPPPVMVPQAAVEVDDGEDAPARRKPGRPPKAKEPDAS